VQLIEVTIDSLAAVGFVGTTLAEIAGRAGVSPGLVAHYFGDKDGLLEAAFRALARVHGSRQSSTPISGRRISTGASATPGSPSGVRYCISRD